MKSKVRLICQETFKGYGKSLSVLSAIKEAFKVDTQGLWFIIVLTIRGIASAFIKQIIIFYLLRRKRFKYDKPKINFIFVSVPSVVLYLAVVFARNYANPEDIATLEEECTFIFILFMVLSKTVRAFNKVVQNRNKRIKKKYRVYKKTRLLKKQLKKKEIEDSLAIEKKQTTIYALEGDKTKDLTRELVD